VRTPRISSLDGKYFAACDEDGNPIKPQYSTSKPTCRMCFSRGGNESLRQLLRDVHPSYFGSTW